MASTTSKKKVGKRNGSPNKESEQVSKQQKVRDTKEANAVGKEKVAVQPHKPTVKKAMLKKETGPPLSGGKVANYSLARTAEVRGKSTLRDEVLSDAETKAWYSMNVSATGAGDKKDAKVAKVVTPEKEGMFMISPVPLYRPD
jgi:hypothetical protein